MSDRVSYAEAAEILGVHFSAIAKMRRRGELTTERRRGAALDRAEVEALAVRRRQAGKPHRPQEREPVDPRPDAEHEWLRPAKVAALLGMSEQGVTLRLRRGRMPGVHKGRHWWVRADHLEQVEAARLVSRTRRP